MNGQLAISNKQIAIDSRLAISYGITVQHNRQSPIATALQFGNRESLKETHRV